MSGVGCTGFLCFWCTLCCCNNDKARIIAQFCSFVDEIKKDKEWRIIQTLNPCIVLCNVTQLWSTSLLGHGGVSFRLAPQKELKYKRPGKHLLSLATLRSTRMPPGSLSL